MDVRDRLQTPTSTDAAGDPDRARELFAQGRRRRTRRRAFGAGAGATAVLLAVVAWPGLPGGGPPGPVIDDVASAPEAPADAEDAEDAEDGEPTFDLPTLPRVVDPASDEDGADEAPDDPEADDPEAADDQPTAPSAVGDDASTADREQAPAGPADLVLADVRVGVHDGFDRVTLEFSGDGQVGWFTELGDRAIEHGRGQEFDVDGDAVLTVFATMLQFPPEIPDGTAQWDGRPVAAPAGAQVLTEVESAGWFEGQHQLFLGLTEPVPYRIGRLGAPERIVIDLLHPS